MPSTMATAASVRDTVGHLTSDVFEATGAVATHELHSRFGSGASAAAVAASSNNAASVSKANIFAQKHTRVVASGAAAGRRVGDATGATLGQMLMATAKKIGAHQCDACGAGRLYNYYSCEEASCGAEQRKLGLEGGYDLCEACHTKLRLNKGNIQHPVTHRFHEHHNGKFTGKLLAAAILLLILLRWLFSRIF